MAVEKHFVVVPFPGFGHIIPMLELAKKLRQKHQVTFVMSAMKMPAIKERNILPANIPVVTFEDGLIDVGDDEDLSPTMLMIGMRIMLGPLIEILKTFNSSPNEGPIKSPVLIIDFMYCDAFEICHSLKLPTYLFCCPPGWSITGHLDIDENTPTVPDDTFFNPDDDHTKILSMAVPEGFKDMGLALMRSYPLVQAVLVNSFEDLEPTTKAIFESHPRTGGTPMKFLGPFFPEEEVIDPTDVRVKEWLDKQTERSVVFVSFGTVAFPLPEQVAEIAEALRELKKPFVWSLRTPQQAYLPEWCRQLMKKGFEGEFLLLPWVPQKTILEHSSTEVFVSHCGWNSSLESIHGGVPVVAWPMFADQHLNAEFLVQLGTAVKIPNTSLKAKRLVPKVELLDTILKVTENQPNRYWKRSKEYAVKSRAAISETGKSTRDFQELFM